MKKTLFHLRATLFWAAITTIYQLIFFVAAPRSVAGSTFPVPEMDRSTTKPVSFEMLDDYSKGDNLDKIALDFQLMNELGIDTLRCSFGWDDYEPTPGNYEFAWLKQFVTLANEDGIKLRPYIGYTAPWAGRGGTDGIYWNDPPAVEKDWYDFVYRLAFALKPFHNVLSYEIYNEENDTFWWEGSTYSYRETLRQAALAIHAANPAAQVIMGGLVFPDADWLHALVSAGDSNAYDILPFHAYPETFEHTFVERYLDSQYYNYFVPINYKWGGKKPIWINEMGYATTPGRTEKQQADWYARAVSTFLADPHIQELGFFEIRDLRPQQKVIGSDATYHLGLTDKNRNKKLAFYTVQMMMELLNQGSLTPADDEARVTVTSGTAGELYSHLFLRPDGKQVLFVYDKKSNPTVRVTLKIAGATAYLYRLDGNSAPFSSFDGHTLEGVSLEPGTVAIFRIDP